MDGQVLDSLMEAKRNCAGLHWVPQRFRDIADPEHSHVRNDTDGGFTQCWVERSDPLHVYLDVSEPLYLYGDVFAVLICVGIALIFAVCFARVHRENIIQAVHKMQKMNSKYRWVT